DVQEKARHILGELISTYYIITPELPRLTQFYLPQLNSFISGSTFLSAISATTTPEPKCSLSRVCPPDHFALRISSGAADVVGPKICFDGKIIMSHVLNNVGPGLNIEHFNFLTLITIEKTQSFWSVVDNQMLYILAYLKEIKPGMIVLVASFDYVATKMTKEITEVFVGMGSTLIKSVKHRDNWVFAGRAGTENRSVFEKHAVNDEKTNIYERWPEMVEVGGCLPRTQTDGHKP
uniref:FAM3 metabolism regulating signaling molecule D n=1 Tax=Sander lucioperca TaxID=283035 RepID=A0A8C9YEX0_SANLU